jgi:hypothetical protein
MKTKLLLSSLLSFFFYLLSSQVPQGFNYQAIARDASGNPIINTVLPVRITIQSDSLGGTTFWIEEHSSVTTNNFGLFTLILGKGIKKTGSTAAAFNEIDWTVTPKFIKTEIDYGGWKTMGSSSFWAVPYSMVSAKLGGSVKSLLVRSDTYYPDSALFEVKNNNGYTVFAVYNDGVRAYFNNSPTAKGVKGGFAIGGFNEAKGEAIIDYLTVNKDSTRMYVTDMVAKGVKGGFAIGGFNEAKGMRYNLMQVSSDSTRIYMNESANLTVGQRNSEGFAVKGYVSGKGVTSKNYLAASTNSLSSSKGQFNTFFGYETGDANKQGSYNAFIGYQSGKLNSSGLGNVFIGYQSGLSNTTGFKNAFIGYKAGYLNDGGFSNVFIGDSTGFSNLAGIGNVYLGNQCGSLNNGNFNTFIGFQTGALSTTGHSNIYIGFRAGRTNSNGTRNIMIGTNSGLTNSTGSSNVFLGDAAGYMSTGSGNIFIGNNAGFNETNSNTLIIDNSSTMTPMIWGEMDNNRVVINGRSSDNPSGYTFYVNGSAGGVFGWNNLSDARLKKNIVTIADPLEKVMKLRGVNFEWKDEDALEKGTRFGFLAQEAEEIIPEVVNNTGEYWSMQYGPISALLVEAMKEQQKQIETLKTGIDELKVLVNSLLSGQAAQGNK